ncbi:hypothetical protein K501DRAFT_323467 [Backusella circina FSU 941]|nr:hypothetical protein K501DRAFT_323467 [Backusella circina FSU 941]
MLELDSQELHYYKRELISLELKQELARLRASGHVSELVDSSLSKKDDDFPFLRYLAQHFLVDFPLLKNAKERDFWNKLQSFLDEYNKLKLNNYVPESATDSQHRILFYKLENMMTIALTSSIKTVQGNEEAIKVNLTSDDLVSNLKVAQTDNNSDDDRRLDINICTVRDINEKHTLRDVTHAEFIIQTHFPKPVFVSRRHGQFRQLRDDLKRAFPTLELPTVPSKARDASASLYREKDRLCLRSFLHRLLIFDEVCESDIFIAFLSDHPITLTEREEKDAQQRHDRDQARMEEERRFKEQVDSKMNELDGLLSMLKTKIKEQNGLMEIFGIIKTTETIGSLPPELQKALSWGSINFAFVLHTHFVSSDRSVENTASLKRTHSLIPYRTIAQMLKLSNPFVMVKGVLDLFLAQPFGGKSLLQRIILVNMNDESKEMQKDIEELQQKINDPHLCKKVENTIKTDMPPDLVFSGNNIKDTLDMLKNPSIEPVLTSEQIMHVAFANQPGNKEAHQLVEQLYDLWVLYARKQEKDVLMSLMFQGATGDIIKDLFAIFYTPLAQVYKSANISDTIGHVSGFIDDLVKVIDDLESVTNTTQPFIDLVQRHEQEFYSFVHNVHAQDKSKLFDGLLLYVDSILNFVATGLPTRIDIDKITTEAGIDPAAYPALKQEIQSICMYHLARKERHLERKRQKLMSTTEPAIEFSPDNDRFKGALDDFSEMEEGDWDQSTDSLAHEMTLKSPTLKIIPTILPTFVNHVTRVLNE